MGRSSWLQSRQAGSYTSCLKSAAFPVLRISFTQLHPASIPFEEQCHPGPEALPSPHPQGPHSSVPKHRQALLLPQEVLTITTGLPGASLHSWALALPWGRRTGGNVGDCRYILAPGLPTACANPGHEQVWNLGENGEAPGKWDWSGIHF